MAGHPLRQVKVEKGRRFWYERGMELPLMLAAKPRTPNAPTGPAPEGGEAVSVKDFRRSAVPPPVWLQSAWASAKRRGLDTMTQDEFDAELGAYRREQESLARAAE